MPEYIKNRKIYKYPYAGYSPDLIKAGDDSAIEKKSSYESAAFETVSSYYRLLDNINISEGPADKNMYNCFAVRLCRMIIDFINANSYRILKKCVFGDKFYSECLEYLCSSGLTDETGDEELLLIYCKQIVNLLNASKLLKNVNDAARVEGFDFSDRNIFMVLFSSLWNRVDWADIFPSDPESAQELKENKAIIKDLLLSIKSKKDINSFANEFFCLTGFARENDILLISFIDFYLLTWFSHFGIIRYHYNKYHDPVNIELTDTGRKVLLAVG